MAECNIILECCAGQTECNEDITIAFLKEFIGDLIKDVNGSVVHVATSKPDSYVPTYSELAGGSLVPIFRDGGSNKQHDNIDGITIMGSYAGNEAVKQEDLKLTYTRFKSLSISAGKTTFSECSDNTNITATYKLTKTVRAMSNCVVNETSTEVSDTNCKMTFSSTASWLTIGSCSNNVVRASAPKNGSWSSPRRTANISAKVVYKGETKTSNSITIAQNALTGSYSVYEGRHYTGVNITSHDSTTYYCDGGSFSISATGYYYDRYKWKDSCNLVYDYNYDDRYGSEYGGYDSGSFSKVLCPTERETNYETLSVTYHGYSDSLTFIQDCSQTCEACDYSEDFGYCDAYGTAGACAENVTVYCNMPITTHTRSWVEGECVDVTGTTERQQSITVSIPDNTTQSSVTHTGSAYTDEGGTIYYTITQASGPCGGCTGDHTEYEYDNTTVNISACDSSATANIRYTATTTYDNCATVTSTGTVSQTYDVGKNETSEAKSYTKTYEGQGGKTATVTINQSAGPCTCACSMLTVSPTSLSWAYDSTSSKDITISSASCNNSISTGGTLYHFTATVGSGKVTVSPNGTNTSGSRYEETLTIYYYADSTSCSSSVTLTQNAQSDPCAGKGCGELTVTGVTAAFSKDAHTNETVGTYNKSQCATVIDVTSSEAWLTVSDNSSTNTIKGTMAKQGCSTSNRQSTVTLTYQVNGQNCSSSWTVTQNGDSSPCPNPCSCSNFSANTTSLTFNANGTLSSSFSWIKSPSCESEFTLSGDSNVKSASLTSSGGISMTVNPNTSLTNNYTGTVKVMLGTTECKTINYTVGKRSCICSDLSSAETVTTSVSNTGATNFVVWRVNKDSCAGKIEATSSSCDPIFTSVGTGVSGSYYVISATASSNTSENAKTCNIGYKYYVTGNSTTPCDSGSTTVTVAGTGTCDCSRANAALGNPSVNPIPSTGGTNYSIPYTANCGTVTAVADNSWITIDSIDTTNKKIIFRASNNTGATRSTKIKLRVNGNDCSGAEKTISQSAFVCTCESSHFIIEKTQESVPATGGSVSTVYTADCGTVSAKTESTISWIKDIVVTDNIVSATVSKNESSSGRSASIKIYLVGQEDNCNDYLHIDQEASSCDCNNSSISMTAQTGNFPYTGASNVLVATYSTNCTNNLSFISTDGLTNIGFSNGRIYATIPANNTLSSKSYTIKAKFGNAICSVSATISQQAKPCDCTTANIGSVSPVSLAAGAETSKIICSFTATCGTFTAQRKSGGTFLSNLTVRGVATNNYVVTANITSNSGIANRSEEVSINIGSEECTSFRVTQSGLGCNCQTADINSITSVSQSAAGSPTTRVLIGSFEAECGSFSISHKSGDSFLSDFEEQDYNIFAKVATNTAQSSRSETLSIKLGTSECATFTVTQAAAEATCNCGNLVVSGPSSPKDKNGATSTSLGSYTATCESITNMTYSVGWIHNIDWSNGSITGNIDANCGAQRTATITVTYTANGSMCNTKSFTVTQNAGGISGLTPDKTLDCHGGTVTFTVNRV